MVQKSINLISEIRKELEIEPVIDVYQKYFAGKKITNELMVLYEYSFNTLHINVDEFKSNKIYYINKFVKIIDDNENGIQSFPRFIDIYLKIMYSTNGLKLYTDKNYCPQIVQDWNLAYGENYLDYVKEFEINLIYNKWWSDYEAKVWNNFQEKRKKIEEFENFVLDLIDKIVSKSNYDDEDNNLVFTEQHYEKLIEEIKLEIRKIEYFKNINEESILANFKNYLNIIIENKGEYLKHENIDEINEIESIPINLEGQEKFVYCSKLGIIDFLKEKIKKPNVKHSDSKLNPLISIITGNKVTSVKRLMAFHNNPANKGPGNPFKNIELMARVNRYLINNNLIKTGESK